MSVMSCDIVLCDMCDIIASQDCNHLSGCPEIAFAMRRSISGCGDCTNEGMVFFINAQQSSL